MPRDSSSHLADHPCIGCGYDLRRLDPQGVCPECGQPIAESIRGDELRFSNRQWLERIVRGHRLLTQGFRITLIGLVMIVLGTIILAIVLSILDMAGAWVETAFAYGIVIAVLLGLGLGTVGGILVTDREPREREREGPVSLRQAARWGAIVTTGLIAGGELFELMGGPVARTASTVLTLAGFFALAATMVALLHWEARLVDRLPDRKLAQELRQAARFLCVGLPLAAGLRVLSEVLTGMGGPTMIQTGVSIAGSIVGLWILARCFMLLGTLARLSTALSATLKLTVTDTRT